MTKPNTPDAPSGMVLIPAGNFTAGFLPEERVLFMDDMSDENHLEVPPQSLLYLPDYFIDIYPVTCQDYKKFTEATGYPVPSVPPAMPLKQYEWTRMESWKHIEDNDNEMAFVFNDDFPLGTDNYPVVFITWYDALAYCEWAGKRLPTEAEWEKAARGTSDQPFPWGWESDFTAHCHVYSLASPSISSPAEDMRSVNAYPSGQSPYGCFDMLGNIAEWCSTPFNPAIFGKPSAEALGEATLKSRRVVRGGGRFGPEVLHVAYREWSYPWLRDRGIGFRCVCSP